MEMGAQQLSAFVTERAAMLLHLFEDAHQIAAISRKDLRFGDRDVVSGNPYSSRIFRPRPTIPPISGQPLSVKRCVIKVVRRLISACR